MIKRILSSVLCSALGRFHYYRLARFLWLDARRDGANRMAENGEFQLVSSIMQLAARESHPVFLDIGANIGGYSEYLLAQAASQSVTGARLLCFDPNPACAHAIRTRLASAIEAGQAMVLEEVITDTEKTKKFYITGEVAGTSSLRLIDEAQQAGEIEVACTTLDRLADRLHVERFFFVKVDTEGNDFLVLKGAAELLRKGRIGFLQFEYNYRWIAFRHYLKDVFDLVQPLGYHLAKLTPEGLEIYPSWHFELESFREGNYVIGRDFSCLGLPLLESAAVPRKSKKTMIVQPNAIPSAQ